MDVNMVMQTAALTKSLQAEGLAAQLIQKTLEGLGQGPAAAQATVSTAAVDGRGLHIDTMA